MHQRPVIALLLLAVVSQIGCANGSGSADKLDVVNSGFEESAQVDRVPGWKSSQHGGKKSYVVNVDGEDAAKGKQSLRFEQIREQHFGLLTQNVAVMPDMVGKTVELSAMLKSSNISPPGYNLWLAFYDRGPSLISNVESDFVTGTTPWRRYAVRGQIPPGTVSIQIGLHMFDHGKGGVGWADEVRLQLVDANAPIKP